MISAAIAAALLVPGSAPAGQSSPPGPADEQLATGIYHACAVRPDGSLVCWGFSGDGQLGYGNSNTVGETNTPGSVGPLNLGGHTVHALAAGPYHTCAILDDATVRCWGYGFFGALGYGSTTNSIDAGSAPPVDLGAGRTATAITAGGAPSGAGGPGSGGGMHTCVILGTVDPGHVECWGDNTDGALGYPGVAAVGTSTQPVDVGPVNLGTDAAGDPAVATSIAAGGQHTCAILQDGSVKCWGYGAYGELGSGSGQAAQDPSLAGTVDLGTDSASGTAYKATAITAGDYDTCVILNTGAVECWGDNDHGELGYGITTAQLGDSPTTTPDKNGTVDLGAGNTAVAISAGADHTCAILQNGHVECWGNGANGQLGYGNTNSIGLTDSPGSVGPVDLGAGRTATAISAGLTDTCARLDNGSVQCWGLGSAGALGHCNDATVGATNTPGSVPPVDIGYGGAECPPVPPPATTTTPPAPTPSPTPPGPSAYAAGVRAQTLRAKGLRACEAGATRKERAARKRTLRLYPHTSGRRKRLLRGIARAASAADARCLHKFSRTPGRVAKFSATARANGTIALQFDAVGSDGTSPPAARSYLIRQSARPVRTLHDWGRASALCAQSCTFPVTQPGTPITLIVTHLHSHATYYYAIAARDNVTGQAGPLSATVHAKTR